jgi:hypothetical protein
VPILLEHQRDPVAAEMAAFPSRDWDAFVAHDAKLRVDPTVIRRTIVAGGEVVGRIAVWGETSAKSATGSIGWHGGRASRPRRWPRCSPRCRSLSGNEHRQRDRIAVAQSERVAKADLA